MEAGQGILEDLLESEELENGQVNGRVKTESSLVGTENGRELDAVTAVDVADAL